MKTLHIFSSDHVHRRGFEKFAAYLPGKNIVKTSNRIKFYFENNTSDIKIVHGLPEKTALLWYVFNKADAWYLYGYEVWNKQTVLTKLLRRIVLRKLKYIICPNKNDYHKAVKLFKLNAAHIQSYYYPVYLTEKPPKTICTQNITVFVCHNTDNYKNVLRALDLIPAKFIPVAFLGYGNRRGAELIKDKIYQKFKKFHIYEITIDRHIFMEILGDCAIYINLATRQMGVGGILQALRMGVNVYLTGENKRYFTELGVKLMEHPAGFLTKKERTQNQELIRKELDPQKTLRNWQQLLINLVSL